MPCKPANLVSSRTSRNRENAIANMRTRLNRQIRMESERQSVYRSLAESLESVTADFRVSSSLNGVGRTPNARAGKRCRTPLLAGTSSTQGDDAFGSVCRHLSWILTGPRCRDVTTRITLSAPGYWLRCVSSELHRSIAVASLSILKSKWSGTIARVDRQLAGHEYQPVCDRHMTMGETPALQDSPGFPCAVTARPIHYQP